jgi:hypothetical protein
MDEAVYLTKQRKEYYRKKLTAERKQARSEEKVYDPTRN